MGLNAQNQLHGKVNGINGANGNGIESIVKTSTSGLVDTYTITFTDGNTETFDVTNGAKGDTGNTGNGISSVELNNDYTLTINFTNGESFTTTSIRGMQGEKGDTPTKGVDYFTNAEIQEFKDDIVNGANSDFNENVTEKMTAFNSNAISKTNTFNDNATTKTSAFNTNASDKTDTFDSNASAKTSAFNSNSTSRTSDFDTNATNKTTAYNQNATTKTNEYNTNAQTKLEAYNTNAQSKTDDFDTNAEDKLQEYNDNASALMQSVDDLEAKHDAEVAELRGQVDTLQHLIKNDVISFDIGLTYAKGQWLSDGTIGQSNNRIYATSIIDNDLAFKIIANGNFEFNILGFVNGNFVNSTGWITSFDFYDKPEFKEIKINVRMNDNSNFSTIPPSPITFILNSQIDNNAKNISILKEKMEYFENTLIVDWERGRISSSDEQVESTIDIKTVDFLPFSVFEAFTSSNYKFVVWAYNKNTDEKIGIWNGTNFTANGGIFVQTFNFFAFPNYKFKIVLRHNENININISDSVNVTLKKIDNKKEDLYDVIIFMGQSNMAGRGITNAQHPEQAPTILEGAGYEFRAISDPSMLYKISEPFGVNENNPNGIDDSNSGDGAKTGSMVTAFVNAYYKNGNTPVLAISASKGASSITQWLPNSDFLNDTIQRFNSAIQFCNTNNIKIRHKFIVWCQGETDAKNSMTKETYTQNLQSIIDAMKNVGIEKMLLVRIGNRNDSSYPYTHIIECQTEIAKTNKDVVMISTDFAGMKERGLMKDQSHYYQEGYNECGTYAGINASIYANTGKEPTMYDTEYDNLYYSNKN